MPFMEKEIVFGDWVELDGPMGTEWIPRDIVDLSDEELAYDGEVADLDDVCPYLMDLAGQGRVYSIDVVEGWGARMTAPGYLDATEWSVFETEDEAEEFLDEFYGEEVDEEGELVANPEDDEDDDDDVRSRRRRKRAEMRIRFRKSRGLSQREDWELQKRAREYRKRRRRVSRNEMAAPYALEFDGHREYVRAAEDMERAKAKLRKLYHAAEAELHKFDRETGEWTYVRKVKL